MPTGATVAAADDLAARDARRRAQLGLPLRLDARRDVHPAGAALAQPRLGGRGVHAVRRRPRAQRRRRDADHVRDRRAARPDRVHARRPLRLRRRAAGADRQRRLRPAPERRLRRRARLHPAAHRAAASGCRGGCGRSSRARPSARCASGASPTRASGRRAARRGTTSPRSSCAGWRWTGRPSSPRSAATPRSSSAGGAVAEEIRADILEHGVDARGVLRQHYETDALDASNLLAAIFGFLDARRPAAARERAGDRRRADRERLRPALPHRGDRRRPVRQRGDVPDLLVLARLGAGRRSASCSGRAT